jgi:RNA polymerase sigma factor (sigma-70 family)
MAKHWELTREALDSLLEWLGHDREQAGKKYEYVRQSLIRILIWRGCNEAEDLADETINRVARKVPEIAPTYKGDPAIYFYGVARKMLQEYQKRQAAREGMLPEIERYVAEAPEAPAESERRHQCMEQCLQKLGERERELIRQYYQRDLRAKADSRKELAGRLGMSAGNLRVKAHRLRAFLLECINDCLSGEAE